MSQTQSTITTRITDVVRILSAARPRGMASLEVADLLQQGHAPGTTCDLAFSVCFADEAQSAPAAMALRQSGYAIDGAPGPQGFLTVHHPVPLRPFALATALVRLERLAASHGGHVALVGAAGPVAREATRRIAQAMTDGDIPRGARFAT